MKWLKGMIEDKDMWGWLMVFASAPFLFFGMIFQYDFDWSIYVSLCRRCISYSWFSL